MPDNTTEVMPSLVNYPTAALTTRPTESLGLVALILIYTLIHFIPCSALATLIKLLIAALTLNLHFLQHQYLLNDIIRDS